MKFLLTTLASLTILGLSANAQEPMKCVEGVMTDTAGNSGASCFVTRSGKTIRLFRTSAYSSNVTQIDPDKSEACEEGAVLRISPTENNCISGEGLKINQEASSRIIRISEQLTQKSGITIFAGGRRRSQ